MSELQDAIEKAWNEFEERRPGEAQLNWGEQAFLAAGVVAQHPAMVELRDAVVFVNRATLDHDRVDGAYRLGRAVDDLLNAFGLLDSLSSEETEQQ